MIESMNRNYMGKTVRITDQPNRIGQIIGISRDNYIVRIGDNLPESISCKKLEFVEE